jgi:predicted ATPase
MNTQIEAHNYRCSPKLAVAPDRHHVLSGVNGAGKTTLLDIFVLLGYMLARAGVAAAFLERLGRGRFPSAGTLTAPYKTTLRSKPRS